MSFTQYYPLARTINKMEIGLEGFIVVVIIVTEMKNQKL